MHAGAEGSGQVHTPNHDEVAFGEHRGNRARSRTRPSTPARTSSSARARTSCAGSSCDRGRLIAYSLGNLAGYRNFGIGPVTGTSALLTVRLSPRGLPIGGAVTSLRLDGTGVPTATRRGRRSRRCAA